MRILLSNDDGIYAPGIQQLAVALRQLATVQIVAPNRDLGVNALMRPGLDISVSGINARPNLGDDVIYSSTVAAAMERRHLGYLALVVSLDGSHYFATAAAVTYRLLRVLICTPLRAGKIFNVNAPTCCYC